MEGRIDRPGHVSVPPGPPSEWQVQMEFAQVDCPRERIVFDTLDYSVFDDVF
jgi:hypothetical protein